MFSIDAVSGALTRVSGSPFATGGSTAPWGVSSDASGTSLYVTDVGANTVLAFTSLKLVLSPVSGLPTIHELAWFATQIPRERTTESHGSLGSS